MFERIYRKAGKRSVLIERMGMEDDEDTYGDEEDGLLSGEEGRYPELEGFEDWDP
jgi:hypothetical protein